MTNLGNKRALELAAALAVILHLVLFVAVRPSPAKELSGESAPPDTYYLAKAGSKLSVNETDPRKVWSPLLFSLPSEQGFSNDSLSKMPRSPTFDLTPSGLGHFLELGAPTRTTGVQILPQTFMLTAVEKIAPQLPASEFQPEGKLLSARRVYVAPELKERLVGGIILPPELNKEVDEAWEVHASISISEEGEVRHVFLDHPLEPPQLNRQVQRLLRSLRFKPGVSAVEGRIEIYSPETSVKEEVQP